MSGGIDSSATALLLKEASHEVLGLHMLLARSNNRAREQAEEAAAQIGVPIRCVDLTEQFAGRVVEPFVREYAEGRTPSPCLVCNRDIKLDALWNHAQALGCESLSTGHYAAIHRTAHGALLRMATDRKKDQSYFLSMLTPAMLYRLILPLGTRAKAEARDLLRNRGITAWRAEESQELCFVPSADYRAFLDERGINARPGPIYDTAGKEVGRHRGIIHFTVGQRKGIGIPRPEPLYVIRIDPHSNAVIVGSRSEASTSRVCLGKPNILVPDALSQDLLLQIKVRSTSRPVNCRTVRWTSDALEVQFVEPQPGVAPGQAAVLYDGDTVVAAGWIAE
jgi:tRNA-specific 2-thiouridylase